MNLTAAQQTAIAARGNVLVVAGAGTGKTRTLVERCLSCLLEEKPRASLDEILMVTFTEAAAAEMRQRIRLRLEQEAARQPEDAHWREQLALFETAQIGTLHSFCYQLVRQHFYELELDPQVTVLAEEEARLLADETLEELLQKHYAGRGKNAEAVQRLIQAHGRGSDKPIRALVLRLHHYTQTLPDPAGWIRTQSALFNQPAPGAWEQWYQDGLGAWRQTWLPALETRAGRNLIAAQCLAALATLDPAEHAGQPSRRAQAAEAFAAIAAAVKECPHGKKTLWVKPLEGFVAEAAFLASLTGGSGQTDPLSEDWTWVRGQMATLLDLASAFAEAFSLAKRELGVVDFHDLEQYALQLLWDVAQDQPTPAAQHWRRQLRFVFVDEYQDINAAQDKIIEALSREAAQANRFLVGDVKQSIYRFRLANPHIFFRYLETWRAGAGRVVPLVDNFRSQEGLLGFINSLFTGLMRPELGGIAYDVEARLQFGAPEERRALSAAAQIPPAVELHWRVKGKGEEPGGDEEPGDGLAAVRDLEEADKEARLVALRLRELRRQGHPVWDESAGQFRPTDWRDMAVLLRSPANKAESYAKEFARLGLPLQVARGGFYQSSEVLDLLSLLQLLDNPLQDLPAIAVLHSPLVGLTLDELATIRLAVMKTNFWTALRRWAEATSEKPENRSPKPETNPNSEKQENEDGDHGEREAPQGSGRRTTIPPLPPGEGRGKADPSQLAAQAPSQPTAEPRQPPTFAPAGLYQKVTTFLDRFARWRRLARQVSLSRCLEAVLTETHYADWLLTQPRGDQRRANVQRLLGLAQEFDQFQRQGLYRFLRFIEAQQLAQTEPETAALSQENAVRLMSIHQCKGLEFPVVVVADLGKSFNLSDLRADLILDEQYGLCPRIKPPHTGKRYPSLPYWLAGRRQSRELLGEELRLLYVAMTRARDLLLLSASVPRTRFTRLWDHGAPPDLDALLQARSYADWLAGWFSQQVTPADQNAGHGENALMRWHVHEDAELVEEDATPPDGEAAGANCLKATPEQCLQLRQRLAWRYRFTPATRQPAKTSVSVLRRQAAELDEETAPLHWRTPPRQPEAAEPADAPAPAGRASGTEIGTAHHVFLQFAALGSASSARALRREAERLVVEGKLRPDQLDLLDFASLAAFWQSELGGRIRAQAQRVRRELLFTARFSPAELTPFTGEPVDERMADEFVVVQGVADLTVILPAEIWLVDFKTDQVTADDLAPKTKIYEPQLKLYARALAQIYQRPVTECWLYFFSPRRAVRV